MFDYLIKKYVDKSKVPYSFSSVFAQVPNDPEILQQRGRLYSFIEIRGPESLDSKEAANYFLDCLENLYFSTLPVNIPTILERSIKNSLFKLNEYFSNKGIDEEIVFNFSSVVIKDDLIYISKVQDSNILLVRENKLINLGDAIIDPTNSKLIENGSGIVKSGDSILLTSKNLSNLITDWPLIVRYTEDEIKNSIVPGHIGEESSMIIITLLEKKIDINNNTDKNLKEAKIIKTRSENTFYKNYLKIKTNLVYIFHNIFNNLKPILIKQWGNRDKYRKSVYKFMQYLYYKIINPSFKFIYAIIKKKVKNPENISKNAQIIKNRLKIIKINPFINKLNNKKIIKVIIIVISFIIIIIFIKNFISHIINEQAFTNYKNELNSNISLMSSTNDINKIDKIYNDTQKTLNSAYSLNIDNKSLDILKNKIQDYEYEAHLVRNISTINVISNFSNKFPGSNINSLDLYDNNKLILSDSGLGKVYTIDTKNLSIKPILSAQITTPLSVSSLDDGNAVILDKNNGILNLDTDGKVTSFPSLSYITNVTSIASYQNNIYMLSPSDGIIYKSIYNSSTSYSVPTKFISDNNLSLSSAIAIDGNVYSSSPSNGIIYYKSGKESPFNITNMSVMDKPFGPLIYVYTNEYISHIYLVDPQYKRIIEVQKPTNSSTNATITRQYIYTGSDNLFNNLIAVTVDKSEQTMYVLSDDKVLKIAI